METYGYISGSYYCVVGYISVSYYLKFLLKYIKPFLFSIFFDASFENKL